MRWFECVDPNLVIGAIVGGGAVLLGVFLCGFTYKGNANPQKQIPMETYVMPDKKSIYEFTLKDKTRCVVTSGGKSITCDWGEK